MKIETPILTYQTTRAATYACEYHIIWCTKYRRSVLSSEMQERFKELVIASEEKHGCKVRALETMTEHIHLLISIPPTLAVGVMIGKLKGMTAKVLREAFPHRKSRLPNLSTRSYFVASTGGVTLQVLKQYVETQKGV